VAIFGAISVANGGFWLPNPIMIKSHLAGARTPGEAVHNVLRLFDYANLKLFYWQLLGSWSIHLVLLAIAAVSIFMARVGRGPDAWQPRQTLLIMFAGTGLLHLRLAQTGWFFRYDAYLMAFGMFVIALTVGPGVPRRLTLTRAGLLQGAAAVMLMIWFGYPAAERASNAWDQTPDAMSNIYAQHYQMAVFVQTYYTGQAVAIHDIGAVNYMADVHLLDLWGLANNDVARAVQEGTYTTQRIDQLAAQSHVKIAIVYDHLFERFGGLPDGWLNAGEWTLTHRATSTGVKVTFYAVDFNEFNRLVANLQAFSSRLPDDVAQRGFYVEWGDE
jgi:hypothetical protein